MKYIYSYFKGVAVLLLTVILLTACNSNSSAEKNSDTSGTTADTAYPSTQGAEQSMMPADTTSVKAPDTMLKANP